MYRFLSRIAVVGVVVTALLGSGAASAHASPRSSVASVAGPQSVVYYALIARHSHMCLDLNGGSQDDGAAIIQWTCHVRVNQQWQLQSYYGYACCLVVVAQSGKCLDVVDASTEDGAKVQQWTCHQGPNQQWRLSYTIEHYLVLTNAGSGKCLDVTDVSTEDGARIQQWTCHGGPNQQWIME